MLGEELQIVNSTSYLCSYSSELILVGWLNPAVGSGQVTEWVCH